MATHLEAIKEALPEFTFSGTVSFFAWFLIVLLLIAVLGVVLFLFIRMLKYNKVLIIFEKIGGRPEITRKDRAMEVKVDQQGGETVFFARKHKKYLPTPKLQTGRRTYWYYINEEDGLWYNITPEDINIKLAKLDITSSDKGMNYARVALQRNLRERYQKPSFLSIYGGLIAYVGLIAITGIMTFLLFDKFLDITSAVESSIIASEKVIDATRDLLLGLDNIQGGGSLQPA